MDCRRFVSNQFLRNRSPELLYIVTCAVGTKVGDERCDWFIEKQVSGINLNGKHSAMRAVKDPVMDRGFPSD